jgi:hypothetical protein
MSTALAELGPGLCLDLVGVGIGADQHLPVEAGVGPEGKAVAWHGRESGLEQSKNNRPSLDRPSLLAS